jgi:hypothetical protein
MISTFSSTLNSQRKVSHSILTQGVASIETVDLLCANDRDKAFNGFIPGLLRLFTKCGMRNKDGFQLLD